ncbi:AMP-binding protein [Actinomadura sp. J1-007]|uniref:AMP-binding protein n=1 Tax=Actinomadura sp. J1-007 TaxID=2661913 RepID=UPI00136FEE39|nr:AMP-binding protein [Actinomadura sp. J1-007]
MTTRTTGGVLADSETARLVTAEHVLVGTGHEPGVRWRPGERLEHLFEDRCDRLRTDGGPLPPAVDAGDRVLTFGELDERANRLARLLLARGVRPGDRVGLLLDEAVHAYAGMLAVLKAHASYVPLDAGYPTDRLEYIVRDAGVRTVLSLSHLRGPLDGSGAEVLCLDELSALADAQPGHRLTDAERGDPVDDLCYIVYTSGSTGRPKGVAIEHASICNFVRVAVEVYGVGPADRMYQGMTIAFDFSVEEIWVPLVAGATLVPKPAGASLVGDELRDFLVERRVTALCCVPTLLATLDGDVPGLDFLLVSGEACPQDLVARWHRPGRRFLNVYGPTEATVTATWTPLSPDRPVTIGIPCRRTRWSSWTRTRTRRCRPARPARSASRGSGWRAATWAATTSPPAGSSPTSSASPATRPAGSTAPATSAGSARAATWSTSAASTPRSRSAATASS